MKLQGNIDGLTKNDTISLIFIHHYNLENNLIFNSFNLFNLSVFSIMIWVVLVTCFMMVKIKAIINKHRDI